NENVHLISFADIAIQFLADLGYEPHLCQSEDEARILMNTLPQEGKWPCLFTESDTTGEKDFEEFFTENETLDMERYHNLGVIKNKPDFKQEELEYFTQTIAHLKASGQWTKKDLVDLFYNLIPDFGHKETGKYLDSKM
ncbi:MAG: UDP-N-acetylglucosamine 4,6-dehydratase, partial [Bacteroidetes bacterium CG18_big_fil_WC_8_21_14_2_50_41_14]